MQKLSEPICTQDIVAYTKAAFGRVYTVSGKGTGKGTGAGTKTNSSSTMCYARGLMIRAFFISLCLSVSLLNPLFGIVIEEAAQAERRIQAHLIVQDVNNACFEAEEALKHFPEVASLYPLAIEAWGRQGNEKAMFSVWKQFKKQFSEDQENESLLEALAWGILKKGSADSSAFVRMAALLGAAAGNDCKGVKLIAQGLRDTNIIVRGLAVQLVPSMRDSLLVDELMILLKNEEDWRVRLQVIKTLGEMQYTPARKTFLEILSDGKRTAEERAISIAALINMTEEASREEVKSLIKSPRAGLRLFGCEVVMHLELDRDIDLIQDLIQDNSPEVRGRALVTLGVLKSPQLDIAKVSKALGDSHPFVGIAAAWLMTLYDDPRGLSAFRVWLRHPSPDIQARAAAALSTTGKHALPLLKETFAECNEDYVKLNLAWGLIGQREEMEVVASFLLQFFTNSTERWSMESEGIFERIVPSRWRTESSLSDLETENQITRLKVLNQLALIDSDKALPAIKHFLTTCRWGVTGVTALLLLQEGDDEALQGVKQLLNDDQPQIKIQAALALAQWGRDVAALHVLQEAYPHSDRKTKEVIIEAIGRIGDRAALSFLVQRLDEPHQTLRLLAAAAIIEVLNS